MAKKFWVARNRWMGVVQLFDRRPVYQPDEGTFVTKDTFEEGISLGSRPRLGFELRGGMCVRVTLTVNDDREEAR